MNTKIEYQWTKNEDMNIPNNNYGCETTTVVLNDGFDFGDFLEVRGFEFEYESESNTYYILEDRERTGEAFLICSEEEAE
jgi:hypothetical protein